MKIQVYVLNQPIFEHLHAYLKLINITRQMWLTTIHILIHLKYDIFALHNCRILGYTAFIYSKSRVICLLKLPC